MNQAWRVGRVAGADLLVKPSLLLMGVVLVIVFATRFDDRTTANPYALAIAFVVGLYASVLVHELAHVVAARGYGMTVQSVTLHLLGGETLIEGESRTPWQELWVAGVGPLASAAIGGACLLVDDLFSGSVGSLLTAMGLVNLLVAAFNLIPGLPLDGGRVLRALIWGVTGRELVGIRVAAWIGRVAAVAVLAVVAGLLLARQDGYLLDLVVAILVAGFLWTGSTQALQRLAWRERYAGLVARELAEHLDPVPPGAVALDADLSGEALLRAISAHPADHYVLTETDGTVAGVLSLTAVDQAFRRTA